MAGEANRFLAVIGRPVAYDQVPYLSTWADDDLHILRQKAGIEKTARHRFCRDHGVLGSRRGGADLDELLEDVPRQLIVGRRLRDSGVRPSKDEGQDECRLSGKYRHTFFTRRLSSSGTLGLRPGPTRPTSATSGRLVRTSAVRRRGNGRRPPLPLAGASESGFSSESPARRSASRARNSAATPPGSNRSGPLGSCARIHANRYRGRHAFHPAFALVQKDLLHAALEEIEVERRHGFGRAVLRARVSDPRRHFLPIRIVSRFEEAATNMKARSARGERERLPQKPALLWVPRHNEA